MEADEFLGLSDTHVHCGKWFVNIGREMGCWAESTWTGEKNAKAGEHQTLKEESSPQGTYKNSETSNRKMHSAWRCG